MMMSDAINEISGALAKAQGAIEGASKGKVNPAFKSKYADLASVWDACRDPLSANGIAVLQIPNETPEGVVLVTMVTHSSGQWFRSSYPVRPVQATPQGLGSAITYARRYALMAMIGIAPEDDDGEAAMGRQQPANNQQTVQRPAQFDAAKQDAALKQSQERTAENLIDQITKVATSDALSDLWKANAELIKALPEHLKSDVRAAASARKELLTGGEEAA
jgi:hypothetical protein